MMCHRLRCFWTILAISFLVIICSADTTTNESPSEESDSEVYTEKQSDDPFLQQVLHYEHRIKELILEGSTGSLGSLTKLRAYNLSYECMGAFAVFGYALEKLETWALRMVDSSSKIPEGMMYGTFSSFGNYDECLDTEGRAEEDDVQPFFYGQYCAINYKPNSPKSYNATYLAREFKKSQVITSLMKQGFSAAQISIGLQLAKVRVGYCFPSNCSLSDLAKVSDFLNKEYMLNGSLEWCESKATLPVADSTQIALIAVITIFFAFLCFATLIDMQSIRLIKSPHSLKATDCRWSLCSEDTLGLVTSFSMHKSFTKIASTNVCDEELRFLYGLRFISIIWVVYAHTYLFQNILSVGNTFKLRHLPENFFFQICLNGTLAAESFVFLSGFAVALFTFRTLSSQDGKLDMIRYYSRRLWRQTPPILLVVALIIIWPLMGSGPIWTETIGPFAESCRTNWLPTALFFVNYEKISDMCLFHTWFLALDAQLYVIAPMLIIPLYRWPKFGGALIALVCSASMAGTAAQTVLKNYPPVPIFRIRTADYLEKLEDYITQLFLKPLVHVSPYCVAIASAYVVSLKVKVTIPKSLLVIGWLVSFVCKFGIVFAVYPWNKGTSIPSVPVSALYASTCRTIWSLTLAWDVVMCAAGHGWLLTKCLSWRPFAPLARLTFSAYLIHPLVMLIFAASNRAPYHFSHYLMMHRFFGFALLSYILALILSVVIETPLISLERNLAALLNRKRHLLGCTTNGTSRLPPSNGDQMAPEMELSENGAQNEFISKIANLRKLPRIKRKTGDMKKLKKRTDRGSCGVTLEQVEGFDHS